MNFFQKLTGALQMPDEGELFEKQSGEILQKEKDEAVNEEPQELPAEEEDGQDESEQPFTIAELARAKTEKKAEPRFSALRIKEEEEDRGEAALGVSDGQLAIDVYETPSEIVVKSTIAGVRPEDLDIGVEENTVNIRGSRRQEDQVKGDNYFYQECYWGTFSRSVILPTEVDSENVRASLKDGILTIRLPKIIRTKEKKIQVLAD